MGINWKVRIRNKWFWLTLVPAVLLLAQQLAGLFGVMLDVSGLQDRLLALVGTVFALLALAGVPVDMTTEGLGDSERAMGYERPYAPYQAGKHMKGGER